MAKPSLPTRCHFGPTTSTCLVFTQESLSNQNVGLIPSNCIVSSASSFIPRLWCPIRHYLNSHHSMLFFHVFQNLSEQNHQNLKNHNLITPCKDKFLNFCPPYCSDWLLVMSSCFILVTSACNVDDVTVINNVITLQLLKRDHISDSCLVRMWVIGMDRISGLECLCVAPCSD